MRAQQLSTNLSIVAVDVFEAPFKRMNKLTVGIQLLVSSGFLVMQSGFTLVVIASEVMQPCEGPMLLILIILDQEVLGPLRVQVLLVLLLPVVALVQKLVDLWQRSSVHLWCAVLDIDAEVVQKQLDCVSVHDSTDQVHQQEAGQEVLKHPKQLRCYLLAAEVEALVQTLNTVHTVVGQLCQSTEDTA